MNRLLSFVGPALLVVMFVNACVDSRAAGVLQQVPSDALGFVVINNLDAADTKVDQVLKTLGAPYPPPLIFLRAVTGLEKGLNADGDFLLAVLPGPSSDPSSPSFAVWVPVSDYEAVLKTYGANPIGDIAAITVAEEDLLIAKRGDWALVVDPNQRDRLKQMLADQPNPTALVAEWNDWIAGSDVAAVLSRDGATALMNWASHEATAGDQEADKRALVPAGVRQAVQRGLLRQPELRDWLSEVTACGVSARLDEQGNILMSTRVRMKDNVAPRTVAQTAPLPSTYQPGAFVVYGAGRIPPSMTALVAATYARYVFEEFKDAERMQIDKNSADALVDSLVGAAGDITAWSVAAPLGDTEEGVSTNNFLTVRVESAAHSVDKANEVMAKWNAAQAAAKGSGKLIFKREDLKLGARAASQHSVDVSNVEGVPSSPEIKQLMERFFGPGGLMRVWIVAVDDHTVLLGFATQKQVEAQLMLLDRGQPMDWNQPDFAAASKLLPPDPAMQLFYSPHGRSEFDERVRKASSFGVGVIGATPRSIPESPPVGIAVTLNGNELQLDAAMPVQTLQALGNRQEGE